MTLKYRVTLTGIKGFYRVYYLNGDTSLYLFHKQMKADLEFPQDQLIMFKALDEAGGVVGRYGLFDLGSGTVDKITLASTVAKGVTAFVYYYDVPNRKSVNITFEGEAEGIRVEAEFPQLVESKGPVPFEFENGYVAYEDLPDDQKHLGLGKHVHSGEDEDFDLEDEDDEEEEEEEDEDGKEIYDEQESL